MLGTNTVEGYYFKSYSDPRKKDSDGDGYDDNMETKKYKSCPLINEVSVHKLRSNYISIEYTGVENWKNSDGTTISYGGNQGWFFIDENEEWYSWLESDYLIQNYGCGLISPSDTLLYLALSDNQYSTYETELVSINLSGYIDFNSYQCYIRMMNLSWFKIMRWVGVNGLQIANGINQYSWYNCLNLNASWNVSNNDLLSKIEKMLDKNYPVTFSIGPVGDDCGIWFYDWIPKDDDKYNFEVQSYPYIVNGHYATITGLLIDNVKGQTMLEISSWGKKFYVNFDEYLDYVGITSNIVYIE